MNSRWYIIVTLLLIIGATGCSRFREMTRRDYALLRDPFTGRFGADKELVDSVPPSAGATGRVSINDTATAAADYDAVAEFDTAKVPAGPVNGERRLDGIKVRGVGEDIAATSGPSLSDFLGKRPEPSQEGLLPRLEYPKADTDVAGIGPFAQQSTVDTAPGGAAAGVDDDFTAWASSQNEEWGNNAGQSTGYPASRQIQQVSQILNPPAAADDDMPTLPSPDLDSESFRPPATDAATPLIRPTERNVASDARETSTPPPVGIGDPFGNTASRFGARTLPQPQVPIEAPVFDVPASSVISAASFKVKESQQAPVFDAPAATPPAGNNPFAEFDQPNPALDPFAAAATGKKPVSGTSADSTFRFDTGWKPSNLVRP